MLAQLQHQKLCYFNNLEPMCKPRHTITHTNAEPNAGVVNSCQQNANTKMFILAPANIVVQSTAIVQ